MKNGIVTLDVTEYNVSDALRRALARASRLEELNFHFLITPAAIPVLQGIGTANTKLRDECERLMVFVRENEAAIVCPRPE